jgi:hypothetical protein
MNSSLEILQLSRRLSPAKHLASTMAKKCDFPDRFPIAMSSTWVWDRICTVYRRCRRRAMISPICPTPIERARATPRPSTNKHWGAIVGGSPNEIGCDGEGRNQLPSKLARPCVLSLVEHLM